MKNNQLSFLFFFILAVFLFPSSAYSQKSKDSIHRLYQAIVSPNSTSNIPQGINFYTLKKDVDLKRKDTLAAVMDLRLIAMGQFKIGNIYDSENAVVEALSLIESYPQKDTVIEGRKALYNQLGQIYRESNNYDKALETYNLSLEYSRSLSDSITIINNKANVYKDLGNYEKAAENLALAYKKIEVSADSLKLAMVLDNLGIVQSKLGNPNALSNLNRALQIRESKNDLSKTYSSYKNLALYFFDINNEKQAQLFANKAYQAATKLNSITYLQDALSLFVSMNADPKIVQFKKITDSIAKAKQLAENKNAFIKYNVENERKNTMAAQLLQEKEKGQKVLYMILGIFTLIMAIFIILLLRTKHKKEKIRQVYNTEARISKKVHDEVANDLYHVMVKIQGNTSANDEVLDDIENIYNKTRDISKENSAVELSEDFTEQLSDLLLSYKNQQTTVITQNISKMNWKAVSDIKKITVYRILKELMTNMSKHSQASLVALSFSQTNSKINITYSDNGVGCQIKNKNGLLNAENRIQTLNGTIIFESKPNEGFKAKITL
ncbi:tetratricopeptide repeat-containing sensor histidine kinase [Aequorivita sp. CIP111184]|uniref:tetratricopeptide repeat-containing sensor histidine kinase n=1 Tax=Aequorivita sp. CIP111184 TaxID=2211356 RepID=UPI000DBC2825|nr:tetratricopeptide repeat-containing sensor histidine kinase [Aequorivita sp. CIP111184]SRX54221.1 Sensor histidine kinase ComP [Aequorivita sp. CIP111184]